jgi:CHAD domain-containing protein
MRLLRGGMCWILLLKSTRLDLGYAEIRSILKLWVMLTKKSQKKYLSRKEKDWLVQLHVFGESGDPEALHQLRLDIKKVKAFVQMVKDCSGKRASKDVDLLKKMFRQAGKIRDANNHLQLLESFHSVAAEYKTEQAQLRTAAAAEFQQKAGEYRKKGKKAGRRLLADIHSIRTRCIKDWYAARLIRIGVLLTASGDQLHSARKRIKELLYVERLLPAALVKELRLNRDYLDKLQDAIGQWHDMAVIVGTYAGREGADSQAMVRECRKREDAVRGLAGDFYLRAHNE